MQCMENIHVYVCKRSLNASLGSCNECILGDCGRFPMYIYSAKMCISYWLRVLKLQEQRYIKLCYNMLSIVIPFDITLGLQISENTLYSNGFSYIWKSQKLISWTTNTFL